MIEDSDLWLLQDLVRMFENGKIREQHDCIVWTGGVANRHDPKTRMAGEIVIIRRLLWEMRTGWPLHRDQCIRQHPECSSSLPCLVHLQRVSRSQASAGVPKSARMRLKLSESKARLSPLWGMDIDALLADERSPTVIAQELQVSRSVIQRARAGKSWYGRALSAPVWQGLGARGP